MIGEVKKALLRGQKAPFEKKTPLKKKKKNRENRGRGGVLFLEDSSWGTRLGNNRGKGNQEKGTRLHHKMHHRRKGRQEKGAHTVVILISKNKIAWLKRGKKVNKTKGARPEGSDQGERREL